MCGIFCYIGNQNAVDICIEGLRRLEYRGYDSFGVACLTREGIWVEKKVGPITELNSKGIDSDCAIAHTRWASYGKASEQNAHPQLDEKRTVALVHNGVIENYSTLKDQLKSQGVKFYSETDTEVIAQLIAHHYEGDLFQATLKATNELEGSYAISFIHKDHPDQIMASAQHSPLVIGFSSKRNESFIASDPNAFSELDDLDLFYLEKGEIALLEKGLEPHFFEKSGEPLRKEKKQLQFKKTVLSKGEYSHYMLKEIFEQQKSVKDAMLKRIDSSNQTARFEELTFSEEELKEIDQIIFIGCGTSFHAAYIAAYLIEKYVKIPVRVEYASEYRYKKPIFSKNTLFFALSQSGETADTIEAVRLVKDLGAKVLVLCNVRNSTLARGAYCTIFMEAGPERAVASTKTFTSQVVILYLFTLLLGRVKGMTPEEGRLLIKHLYEVPVQVIEVLNHFQEIAALASKYQGYNDFFFLGRGILFPVALEGALKLKEIAYINAQGYPAGEMKHGPIALLDPEVPVLGFCAHSTLQGKMVSNLMECKAREAPLIVFGWRRFEKEILELTNDVFWVPEGSTDLAAIPLTVGTQLFAYEVARLRGEAIDKPRNLAKSVTVE
jgi:glucosamine--fructose-6-phosphate aminotransferase (isomerizing)